MGRQSYTERIVNQTVRLTSVRFTHLAYNDMSVRRAPSPSEIDLIQTLIRRAALEQEPFLTQLESAQFRTLDANGSLEIAVPGYANCDLTPQRVRVEAQSIDADG